MAVLQIVNPTGPSDQYPLQGDRAIMGRHPDCDLVLESASVSRQHAQILRENNQYYVEDLHSRNGTFVNGQLISGRKLLQDGDRLKICDLSFTFYTDQPSDRMPMGDNSALALMDDESASAASSIMSKLDVTSSNSGVRLTVNPEAKLRAMIEIAQNLGKAVSLDEVLAKLLDSLFKIFLQADRGFVILRTGPDGRWCPRP